MLESYITVVAWILFPLSILGALTRAYVTYQASGGRHAVLGTGGNNLVGILSFAWLVVRYSAFIKVAIIWTLIGIGLLIALFLISWFVTIVFEHIAKTKRIKERMLKDQKK